MLSELLVEAINGLVPGPSTDRGVLLLFCGLGVVAAFIHLGLRIVVGEPMNASAWVSSLFLGAIVLALAGSALGAVALLRHQSHRTLACACVGINVAAILCPLAVAAQQAELDMEREIEYAFDADEPVAGARGPLGDIE